MTHAFAASAGHGVEGAAHGVEPRSVEYILVLDLDDEASALAVEPLAHVPGVQVLAGPAGTAISKWNIGLAHARGNWIVLGADDLYFRDGWIDAMVSVGSPFVGLRDVLPGDPDQAPTWPWVSHYAMTREFIVRHHGGVLAIPHYHSWYTDVETCERAVRAGLFALTAVPVTEHRHVSHGKAPDDDTYRRGRQWHEMDRDVFIRRQRAGFPDDFEAVIDA
jgi:hypothetical protein